MNTFTENCLRQGIQNARVKLAQEENMEYSKGNWRASHPLNDKTSIITQIKVVGVIHWGASISLQEQRDNAHLIASAPDMYEALKAIQIALCGAVDCDPSYWTAVHRALAKAEGRND